MKYHDKGFILYYKDYIHLQLLNVGKVVLDLSIFQDKICKSNFQCIDAAEFNKQYLDASYNKKFLYELFLNEKINYKDKKNNILIKVK